MTKKIDLTFVILNEKGEAINSMKQYVIYSEAKKEIILNEKGEAAIYTEESKDESFTIKRLCLNMLLNTINIQSFTDDEKVDGSILYSKIVNSKTENESKFEISIKEYEILKKLVIKTNNVIFISSLYNQIKDEE